jgi:hypothetical protein
MRACKITSDIDILGIESPWRVERVRRFKGPGCR